MILVQDWILKMTFRKSRKSLVTEVLSSRCSSATFLYHIKWSVNTMWWPGVFSLAWPAPAQPKSSLLSYWIFSLLETCSCFSQPGALYWSYCNSLQPSPGCSIQCSCWAVCSISRSWQSQHVSHDLAVRRQSRARAANCPTLSWSLSGRAGSGPPLALPSMLIGGREKPFTSLQNLIIWILSQPCAAAASLSRPHLGRSPASASVTWTVIMNSKPDLGCMVGAKCIHVQIDQEPSYGSIRTSEVKR